MKTLEVAYKSSEDNQVMVTVAYEISETETYPIYVEIKDNNGLDWLNIRSFRFNNVAKIDAVNKSVFDLPEHISKQAFDFVTTEVHNAVLKDISLVD